VQQSLTSWLSDWLAVVVAHLESSYREPLESLGRGNHIAIPNLVLTSGEPVQKIGVYTSADPGGAQHQAAKQPNQTGNDSSTP
jgi:hypothetical protein